MSVHNDFSNSRYMLYENDEGVSEEQWAEVDRQMAKLLENYRKRDIQSQQRLNRVNRPAYANVPHVQIEHAEEDQKCCLSHRACLFALMGAAGTAIVIALIACLILGPLGALIGFCNGAITGTLLGIVIAKYTEVRSTLPPSSVVRASINAAELGDEISEEQWADLSRQMAQLSDKNRKALEATRRWR